MHKVATEKCELPQETLEGGMNGGGSHEGQLTIIHGVRGEVLLRLENNDQRLSMA